MLFPPVHGLFLRQHRTKASSRSLCGIALKGILPFIKGEVFVDEKQAWRNFARSGKIEDYIRYTQIRNQAGAQGVFSMEGYGADQNPGDHYPGTGDRGKR